MKIYIKPLLEICSLTSEERFAVTSVCTITGSCPDWDIAHYEQISGTKVNYYAGIK